MIERSITSRLRQALADRPVVLLHGARQTGKTTLARWIAEKEGRGRYLTLDDATVLAAAKGDATGFIEGLCQQETLPLNMVEGPPSEPVVIDEVQMVPELFSAIKYVVDRDRRPGRFLLTGSANALLIPKVSESLAGRMDIVSLWPLSQGEMKGTAERFVDAVFQSDKAIGIKNDDTPTPLAERIVRGGYPEVFGQESSWRRSWFESYLTTILQRDIRDLANIEGVTMLPRLMALLASRSGSLLDFADIGRSLQMAQTTLKRYFTLLEMTFLVRTLAPWHTLTRQRLVKRPKVFLTDTGLMSHLLNTDPARLGRDPTLLGALLENFVVGELTKQIGWSDSRVQMFFFRTQTGREVDVVLENASGNIVGIEVKASSTVHGDDLKGLAELKKVAETKFVRGIVLYAGREVVPFQKDVFAVPVQALWSLAGG